MLVAIGKASLLLAAGFIGGVAGQWHSPHARVHAASSDVGTCNAAIPKSWGDFKGGSDYGLAFEDQNGTLRFVLHPACGNLSDQSPPAIDLVLQRK
jgi:hypothetical protein